MKNNWLLCQRQRLGADADADAVISML